MGKEMVNFAREDLCLHQLFEQQVRRSPQASAVVDARGTFTYEEHDRQAERLALHLRSGGLRPKGVAGGVLYGAVPEADELWDGNTYDHRNIRRALRGSGLRRPQIDASLFANYVRYFVNRGWVQASPGLPREIREGAQHGF